MKELAEEESLRETGTVVEVDHPERGKYLTVGNPIKLSDSPVRVARSPLLGEHDEIMAELGYGADEIAAAKNAAPSERRHQGTENMAMEELTLRRHAHPGREAADARMQKAPARPGGGRRDRGAARRPARQRDLLIEYLHLIQDKYNQISAHLAALAEMRSQCRKPTRSRRSMRILMS